MYMTNAKTQRQGPNATYIPLAGVGVLRRDKRKSFFFSSGQTQILFFAFLRYQHVGILALGDAKVLSFALGDVKLPDASSFAFWGNIGFSHFFKPHFLHFIK